MVGGRASEGAMGKLLCSEPCSRSPTDSACTTISKPICICDLINKYDGSARAPAELSEAPECVDYNT